MPFPEHGVIAAKLFVPGSLPGTATAGGGSRQFEQPDTGLPEGNSQTVASAFRRIE